MQFEIVKVYAGVYTTFYSVKLDGENHTLFEKFISENQQHCSVELTKISRSIRAMADTTGAREQFFKLKEGIPDEVCALYDDPKKNLRLCCIRYGCVTIILGSGGEEPRNVMAVQESPKLTGENQLMRNISKSIAKALVDRQIWWSKNGMELMCNDESMIIEFKTIDYE